MPRRPTRPDVVTLRHWPWTDGLESSATTGYVSVEPGEHVAAHEEQGWVVEQFVPLSALDARGTRLVDVEARELLAKATSQVGYALVALRERTPREADKAITLALENLRVALERG